VPRCGGSGIDPDPAGRTGIIPLVEGGHHGRLKVGDPVRLGAGDGLLNVGVGVGSGVVGVGEGGVGVGLCGRGLGGGVLGITGTGAGGGGMGSCTSAASWLWR
jgi:hypothetical protein